jgi:phosphoribosylpyrophosphate synthetase
MATYVQTTVNQTLLFYHPSMQSIAQQIAVEHDMINLGTLRHTGSSSDSENWPSFADGWPNLFINEFHAIKVNDCVFLASFATPAIIFEQLAVIFALVHNRARNMKVIVPWFPTGTMERVSEPGEIATASTMARLLSAIPMGVTGATVVSFLDIHALQEQFYFGDNVSIELKTAMGLLPLNNTDVIAFPDEGASKRYKRMFKHRDIIVCEKKRIGDVRIVNIKEGPQSVGNRRVFIVDDMIQSGGTMLDCAKAIRQQYGNTVQVHMYATHGVFPETKIDDDDSAIVTQYRIMHENTDKWPSWYRFLNSDAVHCVYVTNSIPKNKDIEREAAVISQLMGIEHIKFICLDIAPIVSSIIANTDDPQFDS